jgi:hypothetical protein
MRGGLQRVILFRKNSGHHSNRDMGVMTRDDIDVHSARALEEIDRARHAASPAAARAHLSLSELHSDRVRELSKAPRTGPALRLVPS